MLSVALTKHLYLWSPKTNKVSKLTSLPTDTISSISFSQERLAVGTSKGSVHIWDPFVGKLVESYFSHEKRIGTMHLFDNFLVTGSRDKSVLIYDTRIRKLPLRELVSHKQEV
jgi:WD40 repeat protein